jgi:hypothetical protein
MRSSTGTGIKMADLQNLFNVVLSKSKAPGVKKSVICIDQRFSQLYLIWLLQLYNHGYNI